MKNKLMVAAGLTVAAVIGAQFIGTGAPVTAPRSPAPAETADTPAPLTAPEDLPPAALTMPGAKPATTDPATVALVFSRLSGQTPDFEAAARASDAYKNASAFEKAETLNALVQKLREDYAMMSVLEPLIVETPARLAPYSATHKGFLVESFKASTFFPVRHDGRSYALVPRGLVDKQWLSIEDEATARAVEEEAAKNGRQVTMILHLVPRYADGKAATKIDGVDYWPLVVDVKKMTIYPQSGDFPLWQSVPPDAQDEKKSKILKLYQ